MGKVLKLAQKSRADNKRLKITSKLISDVRELATLDVEEGCYRPEELTLVVSRADRPKAVRQMKAANPELSSRQIAKIVGADKATVNRDLSSGANAPQRGANAPPANHQIRKLLNFMVDYSNQFRAWLPEAELSADDREALIERLQSCAQDLVLLSQEVRK